MRWKTPPNRVKAKKYRYVVLLAESKTKTQTEHAGVMKTTQPTVFSGMR